MEAKLTVETELDKIIKELKRINDMNKEVGAGFKKTGDQIGEGVRKQTRDTITMMERLRELGKAVLGGLKDDFKALAGINALQGALALNKQFQGSIKESISLSDTIRKLGATFGISQDKFSSFKSKLVQGMGEIGASSDAAAKVLESLADSTVRDENSLLRYSKIASQLASLSREQGNEGGVAQGIERVLVSQGKNANAPGEAERVAHDVTKAAVASGMKASEVLGSMQKMFDGMDPEKRKNISTRALAEQAVAAQTSGGATVHLFEQFSKMSRERSGQFQAMGLSSLFGPDGKLNMAAIPDIKKRMAATGLSPKEAALAATGEEQSAEGLVRLLDNADRVGDALKRLEGATDDYEKTAAKSRTLQEAFNANVNKVKGSISTAMDKYGIGDPIKGVTDALSGAADEKTGMGSAAVVAGGGLMAAVLAGGGIKAIGGLLNGGGGLAGGVAKGKALEEAGIQPVYVTNFSEFGRGKGGGVTDLIEKGKGLTGIAGKAAGIAGKGAGLASAGMAGYEIGTAINGVIESSTQGKTSEGFEGNAVERLIFKMDQLLGGENAKKIMVSVESKDPSIRVNSKPETGRGASQ